MSNRTGHRGVTYLPCERPGPRRWNQAAGPFLPPTGRNRTPVGKQAAAGALAPDCALNQDPAVTSTDEKQEFPFNMQSPVSSES